jgi:hypothetical protein
LIGGGKFLYRLRQDKISSFNHLCISIYTQIYCGKPQFFLREHTDFQPFFQLQIADIQAHVFEFERFYISAIFLFTK